MARAASRFRRRSSPGEPRARVGEPQRAGDLFEHFGVEPGRLSVIPTAIVAAAPCSSCGWLRRLDELAQACPLCAAPAESEPERC